MLELDKKREIVTLLMNQGILIDRAMLGQIDTIQDMNKFYTFILTEITQEGKLDQFSQVFEKYRQKNLLSEDKETEQAAAASGAKVNITFSYKAEPKKRTVQDFTGLFNSRYNALKSILRNRKELQNLTSINRLNQKRERENIALIGMVTDKQETKTGKVVLTVEDPTGTIKLIVSSNSEAFQTAKETTLDEVIGIVGMSAGEIIFANKIIQPDIPIYKEMKKSPDEAYALFIGDFHYGHNLFLYESFNKMLSWIRAESGSEKQKDIAKKVKYIFIIGDVVEGVGIYPNQDEELDIKDIFEQYSAFSKILEQIPKDIQIIICPGNHDAMRIAEPQPPLYKDFAEALWKLPNVTMVSNPAYVNIHASENFPGFEVLMYHGYSFIYYADNVESIRNAGGQARSDLIMKYLLQRRHLAPTHKSTLYLPDANRDSLVIDKIPDFFATGHIHRVSASNYRNVTLLNCSCWIGATSFMEKMGIEPDQGRAVLVNLQSRKVKILKFHDDRKNKTEEQEEEQTDE